MLDIVRSVAVHRRPSAPSSSLCSLVLVVRTKQVLLRKVAHLNLVRPQEAAVHGRALEEALALDGAVVLADGLVVLHTHPPTGRDRRDLAHILHRAALAPRVDLTSV